MAWNWNGAGAALACLAAGALSAATPGPLPPEADRGLARDIFRDLIGLRTTHDVGTTGAARTIERWLVTAGFAPGDVTVVAPAEHPASGNVVVRYRGSNAGQPVLLLGHLDVVEASRANWISDPFTLVERDGYFYGRGAGDMKNGVAAVVESLIRLRREEYTPDRDLIIALTADEEGGGDANGMQFLLAKQRELVDAGLAINLDGGGGTYRDGKRAYFSIGTSEKVYVTYTLQANSPSGHGATPLADNSIYHLAKGLGRVEALKFPIALNATTRAGLLMRADLEPGPESADMRAVAGEPFDEAAAERLSRIPRFNAQLRTTCTPTLISGGEAENVLPQRTRATIQCRLLPGESAVQVQQRLAGVIADESLTLTMDAAPVISPESAPTAQILALVGGVVHSMWPGVPIVPTMSGGYTDARETRSAGIPTYNVGGTWSSSDDRRAHGNDERVGTREFDECVEYVYRLMRALGRR